MGKLKKTKTEGGSGGKRGHSSMNHWVKTDEIKDATRTQRRIDDTKLAQGGLKDHLLHRYWFKVKKGLGFGITAYTEEEAYRLAAEAADALQLDFDVLEDIDIRDLDQRHVVPNMGPPNFRGVWFPRLNA